VSIVLQRRLEARARLRARRFAYPAAVAGVLTGFASLLVWNLTRTSWLDGYDAFHIVRYAEIVTGEGRLPGPADTDVWHNPPLFFVVAGGAQRLAAALGREADPYKGGQLLSVLAAVGIALLVFLIARELFPGSRLAQLAALGFAVTTPVLVRGATMYHPDPLAALLVAAATFVTVRALARNEFGVAVGATAGLLVGLATLTRAWALAALSGLALALMLRTIASRGERELVRTTAAMLGVALALALPWLAYKTVRYGEPLAFSRPDPTQWTLEGRPLEFYTGLGLSKLFTEPYSPNFRNQLLPVTYADWWGDWHRYFAIPEELRSGPEQLPREYERPRALQSLVGIVPSLLILVGLVGLTVAAVRHRSFALLAVLGPFAFLALSFVYFLVANPKVDGDNIKALYLLSAVVPISVCGGWALAQTRRAGRLAFAALLIVLADLAFLDLRFLILPA
jgi:Dolichyl-phosphate-mannose-protein mannosyltransferase